MRQRLGLLFTVVTGLFMAAFKILFQIFIIGIACFVVIVFIGINNINCLLETRDK